MVGYAFTVMASVFVWLGVCGDHADVCAGHMARSQCVSQQRNAVEMASVSMVDSGHLGRGGVREVVHVEPSVCPGIRLGESFGVAFFHAHLLPYVHRVFVLFCHVMKLFYHGRRGNELPLSALKYRASPRYESVLQLRDLDHL